MTNITITLGDPGGVGPEIVLRALQRREMQASVSYTLISHPAVKEWFSSHLQRKDILWHTVLDDMEFTLSFGKETPQGGRIAYESLRRALTFLKSESSDILVTAPLSKKNVHLWDEKFVDHTTFLGNAFNTEDYRMAFWSSKFGLILETIHVPLHKVPQILSPSHLEKTIRLGWEFSRKIFGENSRIVLCGLNPHAGEDGLLGREEIDILLPVAEKLKKEGIPLEGPLPADTVFYHALKGTYQFIVAMYHDQGLAPFKMIAFEEGVNITLGLPIIRTSPDHGTGFSIAGKGIASSLSMLNAIQIALQLKGQK
ncbi:4-hydroxythreonine-4-phosphate dehydrogenase PdxA [Thermospira aquatica]|uniref:4-hydroxythreonine-4-phosphate dehydrogenase PdxA n=1 Tax=Thermospira aquatica TaxID=2828656 RepID=A0AAX3BDJ5_9SPIR|nr:4-hydroxythreonine-4-phosphate dehydrogenase PdxA [Thermospira aquatica]URA10290.1 4-hydroxythreonine-4-phosphate dehydrogenase PdxA [Thermospira aquatica]